MVPFADGTKIRIKSLANNLYLRPIPCTSFTCDFQAIVNACAVPGRNIISAIGQADDPLTIWQLCQYSALSDSGEAKYLIYSESNQNTFAMSLLNDGTLVLLPTSGICTQSKLNAPACSIGATQDYFSFILNENARSKTNTTSGSYNIIPSCFLGENNFIVSNGIGAISLPAAVCPPLVLSQGAGGPTIGCSGPEGDPRCTLNYLFEIETQ